MAKLAALLPYLALWLGDWASDRRSGWQLLACNDLLTSRESELGNGAWVSFFFEYSPVNLDDFWMPVEPANAVDALHQVQDAGGAVAIWSRYDD